MQRASGFQSVLEFYPPDCHPDFVEPLGAAGGFSGAQLWRLTAPRGRLCLRRWPPDYPGKAKLEWIHEVVVFAASRGFDLLPQPIAARNGQRHCEQDGYLWELTPWLPGTANYSTDPRPQKLHAALTTLARFHRAVEAFEPVSPPADHRSSMCGRSPGIAERLQFTDQLLAGDLDEFDRSIVAQRVVYPLLAGQATILLATVRPLLPSLRRDLESVRGTQVNLQPCLRDIWHDHVLFTADEVSGIVDFGSMRIESVAADVSRLLGSLCGNDLAGWRLGLAAYEEVRPLSPAEHALLKAFDRSQLLLAGINWVEWVFVRGRAFADPEAVVKRMEHILARLLPPVDLP